MLRTCLVLLAVATPAVSQSPRWILRDQGGSPSGGTSRAIAYDEARDRTVLQLGDSLGETWEWDGNVWRQVATNGPGDEVEMVYDAARQRMVCVSAIPQTGLFRTWFWDGTRWTQTLGATPLGRFDQGMAYDRARDRVVLFGGLRGGQDSSETWEFDGMHWAQRSSGGAPLRSLHAMAYDEGRGVTVLFGGRREDNSGIEYADTWEWDGQVWRERYGVTAPPRRSFHEMAYDASNQRVLVYGGRQSIGGLIRYTDTWAFDGLAWRQLRTNTAPTVERGSLAFDRRRGVAVLATRPDTGAGSTWEFAGGAGGVGSFTSFGAGCTGTAGAPLLLGVGAPSIGATFSMLVGSAPVGPLNRVIGMIGDSRRDWGGTSLPLALDFLGMPFCTLYVAPQVLQDIPFDGAAYRWQLPIPLDASLVGSDAFVQAAVTDPTANRAGLTTSTAAQLRIGG